MGVCVEYQGYDRYSGGAKRKREKDNAEAQSSRRSAEAEKDEEGFLTSRTPFEMTGFGLSE
jgi:hypothetical protein